MVHSSASKRKILIVDDEESLVWLYVRKFTLEGYDVQFAHSGKEGIRKAEDFLPDVILLDVMMPELDGFETAEHLKEAAPESEVVIISNLSRQVDYDRAKKLGIRHYFVKAQILPGQLVRRIDELFTG